MRNCLSISPTQALSFALRLRHYLKGATQAFEAPSLGASASSHIASLPHSFYPLLAIPHNVYKWAGTRTPAWWSVVYLKHIPKAHAEAWMCFKYTADHLAGVLVPAQFNHVVWYGSLQEWVEDVLETCRVVGDEDEPEDSQDVSSCSDDLPNY